LIVATVSKRYAPLVLCVLFLVFTAARAEDPFQSAPPPAAVPKPVAPPHHYRAKQQLEPVYRAPAVPTNPEPQSADTTPSAAVPASDGRIRQFASARSIPLPQDLQIARPAADVPPKFARFSGVWGGDYRWNGGGRQPLFVVEAIDRSGRATVVYSHGPPNPRTYDQTPARWWRSFGNIEGNTLRFEFGKGWWIKLTLYDAERLYGVSEPNLTASPPFHGAKVWVSRIAAGG
jgi:hypothetical protein